MLAEKTSLVWKGSTKDGYTLRLTRFGLAKIMSKLKQSGLQDLVKRNMNGTLEAAVVRSIAQIVSNATRSGVRTKPELSANLRVFTAQGRRRNYRIMTQPLDSQQGSIIFIQSQLIISKEWEGGSNHLFFDFENKFDGDYNELKKHEVKSYSSPTYETELELALLEIEHMARRRKKPKNHDNNSVKQTVAKTIKSTEHTAGARKSVEEDHQEGISRKQADMTRSLEKLSPTEREKKLRRMEEQNKAREKKKAQKKQKQKEIDFEAYYNLDSSQLPEMY